MSKTYSITQARQNLPAVVHEAERAGEVRIRRRGEVVARLVVAESEFQRMTRRKGPIDWGARLVSLRGFRFDRDEANAR